MGAFKISRFELCRFALMLLFLTSLAACGLMRSESPQPLTEEILKNAEYHVDFIPGGLAKLTEGEYREEYVTDTGMHLVSVVHLELYAFGDLNGDGVEDAVVILSANAGGSGSLVTLEAVINDGGAPRQVATASLGDRTRVRSVVIEAGEITVDMVTHGPGDALCCPTMETTQKYRLEGDTLSPLQQATQPSTPTALFAPATTTMQAGSGIAGLQLKPPWLIINTHDGLWAANMDGSNPVLLIPKSHPDSNIMLDLQTAISSPAQQIAVVTAERNGNLETLSLQTISLPDGKLHKLTNLTTNDIELSPNGLPVNDIRTLGEMAWSPDGKRLAFIGDLDGPKTDVYVYEMDTGKIQKISQDNGRDSTPTWSPDGKSILYYSENGLNAAAADGSSSKLLNISASLLGWRDNETAVIYVNQSGTHVGQLSLYNIRSEEQTVLNQGDLVDNAEVATGLTEDAGAILYDDLHDGLYLLPPNNADPLKLDGEPTWTFFWDEQGRSFTILWEGSQSNLCTLMADGSHKQCAPFGPLSAETHVRTFGLIWGWTCAIGENAGVWISGPGLETVHIMDGSADYPIWNIDNDLLFFVGPTLYRTTFNSHYTDAAPIASVTGEVYDVAWMGFAEALANKYGP